MTMSASAIVSRPAPGAFPPSGIPALWEEGSRLHPVDRALLLLSASSPGTAWEELASLTVGERDAALLALRRELFGDTLAGESFCPECGEQVEFQASVTELLAADDGRLRSGNRRGTLRLPEGRSLEFRLPDSRDLAVLVGADDPDRARRILAERCLARDFAEEKAGEEMTERETVPFSDELLSLLSQAMEQSDPLADIRFDLACPDCGREWSVALDILSWLWDELSREARGLLRDVHVIARAYGWSERSILALPPERRRAYIDMIL